MYDELVGALVGWLLGCAAGTGLALLVCGHLGLLS